MFETFRESAIDSERLERLDEEGAELVLVEVQLVLVLQDLVCHLAVVALADTDGRENRRAGEGRHFDRHVTGLADSDRRRAEQALVEEGVGLLLLGGADDKIGEALELLRERAQQRRGEDIENRVHG